MPLPRVTRLLKRRPKPGSGDFSWDQEEYTPGNRLTLYTRGADLFAAMTEAIEEARESVHLETYIFGNDDTGRTFAQLLAQKARTGVPTRLIFDSIGSIDMDPRLETMMRNAGVKILEYHPVAPWRPRWAWNKRDHRKILVCDGRVGFTGGMNLCHLHAPIGIGGLDWSDAHVRVEGLAAHELDRLFREVWFKQKNRWFDSSSGAQSTTGTSRVRVVGNHEILRRLIIREAYVNALRAAREEVLISNPYFIPDWRIRRALRRAARRGVSVRVLVPGVSDVRSVWHAMRATYGSLLTHGVRVFERQGTMLHAKTVVVDRQWCAVGSYNLDHRSLRHNLEVNLHCLDRPLAEDLAGHFERDLRASREITLDDWGRRPWTDRLLEQFFRSFDYFF